jgi:hypothetical protein
VPGSMIFADVRFAFGAGVAKVKRILEVSAELIY